MGDTLSHDVLHLQAQLIAARLRANTADAEVARVKAINDDLAACNALPELLNSKMRTVIFDQRSERSVRLIDQMELTFEELEASASEDEATAAKAARCTTVVAIERKRFSLITAAFYRPMPIRDTTRCSRRGARPRR
jgi:transposase